MAINEWVLYPWFEEHGASLVHPEDLDRFRLLQPYGKVFAKIAEEIEYVVLAYREHVFRVKPTLIQPVAPPAFSFGQTVWITGKNSRASIVDIGWHHAQNRPFFHVSVNGKRSSKRFWEEELASTE